MFRNRDFLDFSKRLDTVSNADIGDHFVSGVEAKRMCVSMFAPKIPDRRILGGFQAADAHMLARKLDRRYVECQRRSVLGA